MNEPEIHIFEKTSQNVKHAAPWSKFPECSKFELSAPHSFRRTLPVATCSYETTFFAIHTGAEDGWGKWQVGKRYMLVVGRMEAIRCSEKRFAAAKSDSNSLAEREFKYPRAADVPHQV